jgi:8-amino-7-oxononanoate synthase
MGGRVFVSFASDDYLDLATDPRLARAAGRAALRYGCGGCASRHFSGDVPPHRALENALARREECETALAFESILTANFVLISTLASRGDAVFCDAGNGAGLIDGCYLSGASVFFYRHTDLDRLESLLRNEGSRCRRRLIVTDSLFAMSGEFVPLSDIVLLAERNDALVVVDESHTSGVHGAKGRGITDDLPLGGALRNCVLKTSSLSKAFGSQGGYVCGSHPAIKEVAGNSRFAAASAELAVPAAAAARKALALAEQESDRRRRVLNLAERLRFQLQNNGFPVVASRSQIISLPVIRSQVAKRLSSRLEVMGLLVPAICPPFVPRGTPRLRISLTAGHTDADVDRLVESLNEVRAALVV